MEISKNFKSYSKFLSFSKYMVKQLIWSEHTLATIQKKWKKSSVVESLYNEFMEQHRFSLLSTIHDKTVLPAIIDKVVHLWVDEDEDLENEATAVFSVTSKRVERVVLSDSSSSWEGIQDFIKPEAEVHDREVLAENSVQLDEEVREYEEMVKEEWDKIVGVVNEKKEHTISTENLRALIANFKFDFKVDQERKDALKEWFGQRQQEISLKYGETTASGLYLTQCFWLAKKKEIEDIVNDPTRNFDEIRWVFEEWNEKNLDAIPAAFFDDKNLQVFSIAYQMLKLRWKVEKDETLKIQLNERLKSLLWESVVTEESLRTAFDTYWNYTISEIVGELINNYAKNPNSESLRKLQLIAWCFTNEKYAFNIDSNWKFWSETYSFFVMLSKSEWIKTSQNAALYEANIAKILESQKWMQWTDKSDTLYDDFDNFVAEHNSMWKNPRQYLQIQNRSSGDYEARNEGFASASLFGAFSETESAFIGEVANSPIINSQLSELFNFKEAQNPKEMNERMQRILKLLPIDTIHGICVKLLSNQEFLRMLKVPKEKLFMLLSNIVNWEFPDDEFKWDRNMLAAQVWKFCWRDIGKSIMEIAWYLRMQAWVNAIWTRNEFLKEVLWYEIMQTEEDKSKDDTKKWIFHFRDSNNPETSYLFNSSTWEIFIENKIARSEGVISFSWGNNLIRLYQIPDLGNLLRNVDVADALWLSWKRAESMTEIKEHISGTLKNGMQHWIYPWAVDFLNIIKSNERLKEKNWCILKLAQILEIDSDLIEKKAITKEKYGPVYEIMNALLTTFDTSWIGNEDFFELNQFLWHLLEMKREISSSSVVDEWDVTNSLHKFIIRGNVIWEEIKDKNFIDNKLWGYRKWKNLMYGAILWSLIVYNEKGNPVFDLNKIYELNTLEDSNPKGDELVIMMEGNYKRLIWLRDEMAQSAHDKNDLNNLLYAIELT